LSLEELPPNIGWLTSLRKLLIFDLPIKTLPSSVGALLDLRELTIEQCSDQEELPSSIGQLTSLRKLRLVKLALKSLPSTIGALTGLQELIIAHCALKDLPRCIDAMTSLQKLSVHSNLFNEPDFTAIKTISRALPTLRQLRLLVLATCRWSGNAMRIRDVLAIGRSLKVWPPPLLYFEGEEGGGEEEEDEEEEGEEDEDEEDMKISLSRCWRELGLPAVATTWENAKILDWFRLQQQKVVAFASGLQTRMGAASCVSSLNELALVMIADEVLGGWTLHRQWERDGVQQVMARAPKYIMQDILALARSKRLQCDPDAVAHLVKKEKLWEEYMLSLDQEIEEEEREGA
jgi:hypothetical protein